VYMSENQAQPLLDQTIDMTVKEKDHRFLSVFDCMKWSREYNREWLLLDFVAGLSVGAMVIPQSLSYAALAGLPSSYGLYAALTPSIAYSMFGNSRQLSVGPVAVTWMMIRQALTDLVPCVQAIDNPNHLTSDEERECQAVYNDAAVKLALLVSLIYFLMSFLRLGLVFTRLLSHSILGGFTTGAAITIGLSQVKYIVGFKINTHGSSSLPSFVQGIVAGVRELRWQEASLSLLLIYVLIAFKYSGSICSWKPLKSLGALFVCVLGILIVILGQADHPENGAIAIIGLIPSGLPPFSIPTWFKPGGPSFLSLLLPAFVIGLVNLLESISISKSLARKNKDSLDTNREIVALGIVNFLGACASSPPSTGSFSRSAVGYLAGAKSPGAQLVVGLFVAIVLVSLTGFFSKVPFCAMAAIVSVSVASLVDIELFCRLWRVSKVDFVYFLVAFMGTLMLSVEAGLVLAVVLSLSWTYYRIAFASDASKGYSTFDPSLDASRHYLRLEGPISFLQAEEAEIKIDQAIKKTLALGRSSLAIDLRSVPFVDAAGVEFLQDSVIRSAEHKIRIILFGMNADVEEAGERVRLRNLVEKAEGTIIDSHVCDLG
jgi:sulfate transporter 4